jgi:undecaprenyl pyrophosphate synthase
MRAIPAWFCKLTLERFLGQQGELWPSPDFVCHYDGVSVLQGFLPWQLRYSEVWYGTCTEYLLP